MPKQESIEVRTTADFGRRIAPSTPTARAASTTPGLDVSALLARYGPLEFDILRARCAARLAALPYQLGGLAENQPPRWAMATPMSVAVSITAI